MTVVRNESDLLPAWLTHNRALFDHVFVVDHLSDDGTSEMLRAWAEHDAGVRVYSFRDDVYDRERIIKTLRRRVIEETDTEWLFTLDPDEFLPYDSREAFLTPLRAAPAPVLLYRWRNCLPVVPGPLGMSIPLHRQVRTSALGKVAISRAIAEDPLVRIPRGAHNVVHRDTGTVQSVEVGELYHLPFRSVEQAWTKVIRGTINRLRILRADPASGNNWHYVPLLNLMAAEPHWETVLQFAYDYGEPDTERRVRADLSAEALAGEFEEHELPLLGEAPFSPGLSSQGETPPTTVRVTDLANSESHRHLLEELMTLNNPQRIELSDEFSITADDEMVHPGDCSTRTFSLPEGGMPPALDADRATAALRASFWDIDHVPGGSAWGTHIPFLYSLVTLLEPRTYVELGVQAGASFFAACQAVQRQGLDTSCVAIDNWVGDPHAGHTVDGEFQNVRTKIARNYADFAGYIRADFAEAVTRFEPGSIDLLHIDGFHTEEAVTNDFETWLDRMSDRGVIIFHDINEFKSDFGVWRFWHKVTQRYPHIQFGHGHGLGVLVVGEKSPLLEPLSGTNFSLLSPESNELLQILYGGLGQLSWGYAKEIRMHRSLQAEVKRMKRRSTVAGGAKAKAAPANAQAKRAKQAKQAKARERRIKELNGRVRTLRKRLESAQAQLADAQGQVSAMERSTSWRVTRPVRFVGGKVRRHA